MSRDSLRSLLVLVLLGGAAFAAWYFLLRPQGSGGDVRTETYVKNNHGIGLIEKFDYQAAADAFAEVVREAPDWQPGRINLAIALLNTNKPDNLARAKSELQTVLKTTPDDPHAHFCLGVMLFDKGDHEEARSHFQTVAKKDPGDAAAWYWLGLTHPPGSKEAIDCFRKALAREPYLSGAIYNLGLALSVDDPEAGKKFLLEHKRLTDAGQDRVIKTAYGKMGRYATVVGGVGERPIEVPLPLFANWDDLQVELGPDTRWATLDDLGKGPEADLLRAVRQRFGGTLVALDFDRDGRSDLFLAGAVLRGGRLANLLLHNEGGGKFRDATESAGLKDLPPALGCTVGDYDNDGFPDLALTTADGAFLVRNRGAAGKGFEGPGLRVDAGVALGSGLVDIDQDGDLDWLIAAYSKDAGKAAASLEGKGPPAPGEWLLLLNAGEAQPGPKGKATGLTTAFQLPKMKSGLEGPPRAAVAATCGDFDGDRDVDLLLLADGDPAEVARNDRLFRFRRTAVPVTSIPAVRWNGGLVLDVQQRQRSDVLLVGPDRAPLLLRAGAGEGSQEDLPPWETHDVAGPALLQAQAIDLDLDGRTDIVGLSAAGLPVLLRNDGKAFAPAAEALGADAGWPRDVQAVLAAVLEGELPQVVVWSAAKGLQARKNLGNGNQVLALEVNGRRESREKLRCNADGFGVRVMVHAAGLTTGGENATLSAGLGQSSQPLYFGLGKRPEAEVVRLRWPDGTWQAELSLPAGRLARISQVDRTPDSCPLLFAWDGERFAFVADFLGGGALGEGLPDRSIRPARPEESLALPGHLLRPRDGSYVLKLAEPMDEVTYLDRLTLAVIDHPADVFVLPEERFASQAPSQDLVAFRKKERLFPQQVLDHRRQDVTALLKETDRITVDGFLRRSWLGYAEEHWIVLDFGKGLEVLATERSGPGVKLFLVLSGWTDYPYPEAMWAAEQAGVPLLPPVLEREQADGTWKVVVPEVGFPAGRTRTILTDVTGLLGKGTGRLRLRTNMQVLWDQIFLAPAAEILPAACTAAPGTTRGKNLLVRTLPVAQADLQPRGGMVEFSPDGRLPTWFDIHATGPTPATHLRGALTRYGDVLPLLAQADDACVVFGPGDEMTVRFAVPKEEKETTRSFVLRSWGWCKGASPFVVTGGEVGPLPYRAMDAFPPVPGQEFPRSPAQEHYLRTYQTRIIGR